MAHFYLTLPSNSSMNYYPKNTLTRYTTRLENAISLVGDWEVGLFEIQYPHSWFNLGEGEGTVAYVHDVGVNDEAIRYRCGERIPSGYYDSPTELVRAVNDVIDEYAIRKRLTTHPNFIYDPITRRIRVTMGRDSSIYFSSALRDMLGFARHQNPIENVGEYPTRFVGANACDVDRGFSSAYVYCDVLEHVPVGDTKAPLLRIVALD